MFSIVFIFRILDDNVQFNNRANWKFSNRFRTFDPHISRKSRLTGKRMQSSTFPDWIRKDFCFYCPIL